MQFRKVVVCISWNEIALPKNKNDMRTITVSNRGISFQFPLVTKSVFVTHGQHVSFASAIQVTKHPRNTELVYIRFLNIDCTYSYKIEMKIRESISDILVNLIPKVISLKLFLIHFQLQKFRLFFVFVFLSYFTWFSSIHNYFTRNSTRLSLLRVELCETNLSFQRCEDFWWTSVILIDALSRSKKFLLW